MNLSEAIKEKAKCNYISTNLYTHENRFDDMCSINERLKCNMLRVIELQKDLKNMEPRDVFNYNNNKVRAEIVTLNKQIRRDTVLLEKLLYIG